MANTKGHAPGAIKKGERRNPLGINAHTKVKASVRELFTAIGDEEIGNDQVKMERVNYMVRKFFEYAIAGNAAYAHLVANYLWGKPTEYVEVTGKDGGPIETACRGLSRDTIDRIKKEILGINAHP
jgi:hypothetical protein